MENPAPEETGLFGYAIGTIMLIIIVILLLLISAKRSGRLHHLLLRSRYAREKHEYEDSIEDYNVKDLRGYISTALTKGYPRKMIKQACLKSGWKEEIIDRLVQDENR